MTIVLAFAGLLVQSMDCTIAVDAIHRLRKSKLCAEQKHYTSHRAPPLRLLTYTITSNRPRIFRGKTRYGYRDCEDYPYSSFRSQASLR